jgi:very-short-patch-repair endonuclease
MPRLTIEQADEARSETPSNSPLSGGQSNNIPLSGGQPNNTLLSEGQPNNTPFSRGQSNNPPLSGRLPYYPPDKGGKGGYIPYNPDLTEKARENRKNPTPAENRLWFDVLQNKRFADLKFTRQKPLDQYIVDFYCAELMLAIEIDGDSHAEQVEYDLQRTAVLNQLGIEVIRYNNNDVLNNLEGVYQDLSGKVEERLRRA